MPPRLALISLYDQHAFGIRSLHSLLKKNNIGVSCIFYKYFKGFNFKMEPSSEKELDILVKLLKDLSIDIVGISVLSTFFKEATRLTNKIKNDLGIPIIWGGIHPTVRPQDCIEVADFVLRGEAEKTLLKFVNNWDRIYKIDIPGLWARRGKEIMKGSSPELINNLDNLPMSDFDDANKYYIEENGLFFGDPVYNPDNFAKVYKYCYRILSSRGCPFDCSYCSNHVLKDVYKNENSFVRRRSVDSLIEELKYAKEHLKAKAVLFADECFATDMNWVVDFCNTYKKEIGLPFYCEMYPEIINEELISMLYNTGFAYTCLSIQSGSRRIRNGYFNRHISDEVLSTKAELLKKYKLSFHYEIITDNPYEKEEDKYKTLELLLKLPRPLRLNIFSLNFFPETEITKRALDDGLISEKDIEGISSRGMQQFMLKEPRDAKDIFWNYIYFLASDYYCSSANTSGLRHLFSHNFILSLNKLWPIRRYPRIFVKSVDLLDGFILIKRKFIDHLKTHRIPFPKEPILFLKILIFSSLIQILINFTEPRKLLNILNSYKKRDVDDKRVNKIIRYVNFIMNLKPWRNIKNICFIRSLILYYFLRSEGLEVKINFGIKKEDGVLKGHGWLTSNGEVYLENSRLWQDFEVVYSFPSKS